MGLEDYSKQHKKAWEFDAYDFWVRTAGTPEERASKDKENPRKMLQQPTMSYFSTDIFEGEMAHARFYDEEIRKQIPKCHYRKYTISEIINSIIGSGFTLERFDEHPSWENEKLPGEFTAIARKR